MFKEDIISSIVMDSPKMQMQSKELSQIIAELTLQEWLKGANNIQGKIRAIEKPDARKSGAKDSG